jgi:hypothetical protein
MIPPITRIEWKKMLSPDNDFNIQSYSLRLKLDTLKLNIRQKLISEEEAIDDLYKFCTENEDILISDFETIFRDE